MAGGGITPAPEPPAGGNVLLTGGVFDCVMGTLELPAVASGVAGVAGVALVPATPVNAGTDRLSPLRPSPVDADGPHALHPAIADRMVSHANR
jgi:hypothetical protein